MIRTQIQLPDELYRRAKRFSEQRELSLAEMTRRGLELFLDRFPDQKIPASDSVLPLVEAGEILVPLENLREYSRDEESERSGR